MYTHIYIHIYTYLYIPISTNTYTHRDLLSCRAFLVFWHDSNWIIIHFYTYTYYIYIHIHIFIHIHIIFIYIYTFLYIYILYLYTYTHRTCCRAEPPGSLAMICTWLAHKNSSPVKRFSASILSSSLSRSHVCVCCSVLQCVAVCYSVLAVVAVCCSVLRCVAEVVGVYSFFFMI